MIRSMTGFARTAGVTAGVSWAWEMKSVNGRGLDMRVRVPPGCEALGEEARKAATAAFTRGTVNINLGLQVAERAAGAIRLDHDALAALVESCKAASTAHGLAPPSMDALLQVRGVVLAEARDEGLSEEAAAAIARAAGETVTALAAARRSEGEALDKVLAGHLDAVAGLVERIDADPGRTPDAIRQRLARAVAQLFESASGLDQGRLHQEAALIAVRADIREEIDRLKAHVAAARALLAEGGAVGRKLDFLSQEFGREASTLCAKAGSVELSGLGLELRTVVDQMREQVQNVE